MKIKLLIPALFFTLFACNNIKEEDNIPTSKLEILTSLGELDEDSTKTKKEEAVGSQNASAPILTARGSEPGWYAQFFTDHVKLLLNYGKDSVTINHDFTNIDKDGPYICKTTDATNINGKKTTASLLVIIEDKPCTEASGETKERTISLNYNGKDYKGCASAQK